MALKILPEAFAADPDRLARFQREAQVLASLNHPNIAAIYGIEEAEDTRALVLELVEGPTLADRIAKGPIPLDEALRIAKQIAEALEATHDGVPLQRVEPGRTRLPGHFGGYCRHRRGQLRSTGCSGRDLVQNDDLARGTARLILGIVVAGATSCHSDIVPGGG